MDETLARYLRSKDRDHVGQLVAHLKARLRAVARRIVGDSAADDDVVQNSLSLGAMKSGVFRASRHLAQGLARA